MCVRTIYDFAFVTYADLPRGAIKNNSMRRLAATTLMEILPPHIAERVNKKMEEDPGSSHDFLSLVGLVSYYGSGELDFIFLFIFRYINFHKDIDSNEPHVHSTLETIALFICFHIFIL